MSVSDARSSSLYEFVKLEGEGRASAESRRAALQAEQVAPALHRGHEKLLLAVQEMSCQKPACFRVLFRPLLSACSSSCSVRLLLCHQF